MHEPPLAEGLPDRETVLAVVDDLKSTYAREGDGPAMAKFISLVMFDGPLSAEYLDAPAPDPAMFGMSTHAMGLADSIELARTLGQLPKRCIVYAVEGHGFGLGEPLSPPVANAVEDVVTRVLDELRTEMA